MPNLKFNLLKKDMCMFPFSKCAIVGSGEQTLESVSGRGMHISCGPVDYGLPTAPIFTTDWPRSVKYGTIMDK